MAMIAAAAEITMIEPKTAMLLEHMILSHHGKPEFGSPRLPMFPEAEVLSVCDLLDSKMYEMDAALDGVSPDGFSERQWALDNRQLYKID
jgi:3'-5' exoribonuclease